MLKYLTLLAILIALVHSQRRPTYAGTANRLPAVLPQYLDVKQTTSESPVDNRIGDSMSLSSASVNNPPEANGQWNNIEWIKNLEQEKQPFWYLNWQQIQEHIGAKPSEPLAPRVPLAGSQKSTFTS